MIDLHTHSNCSDGSMTPRELIIHAKQSGLAAIALTDHDTTEGIDEALKTGKEVGLCVIPGVEFSTEEVRQVHILGFFIDHRCEALQKAFAIQQAEREENFAQYLVNFEKNGFPMTREEVLAHAPSGHVGRAHYAKVMMDKGYVCSVKDAFDRYLSIGMPLYIKRKVMLPQDAIGLIHEAGGLAFFAHPHQTKLCDEELYRLMCRLKDAGLDGIEGYYPEYNNEMGEKFRSWAKKLDLMLSGGSDFHADMKPHIQIGTGIEGNLYVPDELLLPMRASLQK
ncbi:MAG: PHP domain-containing protein [Ruminococcaceae bacterium]|nr:PHP domain-containing protein [Oscillospiraceae bacterium]